MFHTINALNSGRGLLHFILIASLRSTVSVKKEPVLAGR